MTTTLRPARLEDAAEIHALLLQLADEIPLLVDTLAREEALYALVRNCARAGESLVAIDDDDADNGGEAGRVVGFLLAEPNRQSRHYAEHEILELRYAGVAPAYRRQGVFRRLLARLQGRMLPVTTNVAPQNRSGVRAALEQAGFRPAATTGGGQRFVWQPGGQ